MRLVPTQAPGRGSRKARDYGTEIVQLRSQGYTLEAIRVALANAGVHVTISTVWREANRATVLQRDKPVAGPSATRPPPPDADAATIASASPSSTATQARPGRRKGMEVAEVFMRGQITNPLIRSKEPR